MEKLHERLKSLRIEHELTQQDIADKLFVSRQAVSNWENNKNFPDLKSIVLLSELFQISLDDFLKGEKALVKNIEKELKKINPVTLVGLIFMLALAFLVPVLGLIFSILILKNHRVDYHPGWIKVIAIVAFVFQLAVIVVILLSLPTGSEQFDNIKNTLEIQ
jgi:transcriptional regulator with XRE-family HTH domain